MRPERAVIIRRVLVEWKRQSYLKSKQARYPAAKEKRNKRILTWFVAWMTFRALVNFVIRLHGMATTTQIIPRNGHSSDGGWRLGSSR